jgi:hypothetical protein
MTGVEQKITVPWRTGYDRSAAEMDIHWKKKRGTEAAL